MIPGSKEFFIAAADHDEWGSAHTVFGMVCKVLLCIHEPETIDVELPCFGLSKAYLHSPGKCIVLQVNNLTTVELLLQQAFHTFTHPTYGTVMRMLDQKESFTVHALM